MRKIALIVEGHHDASHVRGLLGLKYSFVVTNGTRFTNRVKMDIEKAIRSNDEVYILTDPDEAGDQIAGFIQENFPNLKRIEIQKEQCQYIDRRFRQWTGVEYVNGTHLRDVFFKAGILQ